MLQLFTGVQGHSIFRSNDIPRLLYISKVTSTDLAIYPRTVHAHPDWFEMVLIFCGRGRVVIADRTFDVREGNLLLYNQGVVHDEMYSKSMNLGIMSMGIADLTIPGLPANCLIPDKTLPVIDLGTDHSAVFLLGNQMFDFLNENKPEASQVCNCLMDAVLHIVLRNIDVASSLPDNISPSAQLINDIRKYIDERYVEPITLQDIASGMNLSTYYLSHVFKKGTGYSPMQYIANRRIGKAQERLIHTHDTITDIAMNVGYNSLSSFNYSFTKHVGMSPSKFRDTYICY